MDDPRYHTKRWQQLRARVIARDGRRCAYPRCVSDMSQRFMVHVDHIVEVDDGGNFWDAFNLQVFCKPHHVAKTLNVRASRPLPVSPNG